MNALGLAQAELALIREVFKRHSNVTGALIFGSRAKGTATPSSDVDLAIEGVTNTLEAEAIASELDELPLPYHFDVVAVAAVKSARLREHITRVGVRIYG